jgi:cobalt/nickel transport system ATP-binding protein
MGRLRSMTERQTNYVFEATGLSYYYPGGVPALSDVTFSVKPGETIALLGANGAGKSTLLKLLDGLIFPHNGTLNAFGLALSEESMNNPDCVLEFRSSVGLVFQDPDVQLFSPTVWEEILFAPLQAGLERQEVITRGKQALELMGIEHLRSRAPYLLSSGEKKKVAISSVLSLRPDVLLLDEPSAGLDPFSQGKLIDFLMTWSGNEHCTVFSTQDLDMVEELATRVLILGQDHTLIADGPPDRFLSDPGFLLEANLIHEHSHRHRNLVHSHVHTHRYSHA